MKLLWANIRASSSSCCWMWEQERITDKYYVSIPIYLNSPMASAWPFRSSAFFNSPDMRICHISPYSNRTLKDTETKVGISSRSKKTQSQPKFLYVDIIFS